MGAAPNAANAVASTISLQNARYPHRTGMLWVTDTDSGQVLLNLADVAMVHGEIEPGAGAQVSAALDFA